MKWRQDGATWRKGKDKVRWSKIQQSTEMEEEVFKKNIWIKWKHKTGVKYQRGELIQSVNDRVISKSINTSLTLRSLNPERIHKNVVELVYQPTSASMSVIDNPDKKRLPVSPSWGISHPYEL